MDGSRGARSHAIRTAGEVMTPSEISSRSDASMLLRRWLAAWIDCAVLAAFFFRPSWIGGEAFFGKTVAVWVILSALYFPLCEGLLGQTLGKRVAGIVVVDEFGFRPG